MQRIKKIIDYILSLGKREELTNAQYVKRWFNNSPVPEIVPFNVERAKQLGRQMRGIE